jgi:hypothetical protein
MFAAFLFLLYLFLNITGTKSSEKMTSALDLLAKGKELYFIFKSKRKVSPDTYVFTWGFEPEDKKLGIMPGRHVKLWYSIKFLYV